MAAAAPRSTGGRYATAGHGRKLAFDEWRRVLSLPDQGERRQLSQRLAVENMHFALFGRPPVTLSPRWRYHFIQAWLTASRQQPAAAVGLHRPYSPRHLLMAGERIVASCPRLLADAAET